MRRENGPAPAEFLETINGQLDSYYSSPARQWSAERISNVGFEDERARGLPYVRGATYFAELDSQIRASSEGKQTLDSFLRSMFEAREKGGKLTQEGWEAMLAKQLGQGAVSDFRGALIDGTRVVVPPSNAFGPCFQRVEAAPAADGQKSYREQRIAGLDAARCSSW